MGQRTIPEKENRGIVLGFPASMLLSSISTPPSSSFLPLSLSPSSFSSFSPSSWTGVGREVETELENEAVDSVTEAVLELIEKDGVAADDDGQLAPSSDFSADIFRAEGKHFCSSIHLEYTLPLQSCRKLEETCIEHPQKRIYET